MSGRTSGEGGWRSWSPLRLRVVSAVALALVALLLTWLGGGWFRLLIAAGAGAIFYEFSAMAARDTWPPARALVAILLGLFLLIFLTVSGPVLLWIALAAAVAAAFAAGAATGGGQWQSAALAYAALPALALGFLRGADAPGLIAILFLFAVVWATDVLAYFAGRRFGGPKLAPAISPGKTWSGAAGGLAGGIVAGLVVVVLAGLSDLLAMALLAALLSAASQLGDLGESALKRRHKVKDSGRLVPGHGGFMDRVDGLVAAAVVLYLVGAARDGLHQPAHGLFAP